MKTMISIYMMFTALVTAARAKGSIECNFSAPTEARLCFGAVGETLIFHLPNPANANFRLKKDNQYMILKTQKNKTMITHAEYVNQFESFTNGTIKLGNAMKKHSGDYVLEEFGSDGVLLKEVKMHLEIQAAVSKPAVSQMCLSPEQMKVSCSSEGDGVAFILTLDGLLLMRTRGHSQSPGNRTANMESLANSTAKQNEPSVLNVTISIHCQRTGNLMCHVSNNFSRDETVIRLNICKDCVSSFPVVTVAVTASVVVLLLLVALCLGIIKHHNKPRPTTVNDGNPEDEIVYTDVIIIKNTKKTRSNSHQNAT